MMKQLLLLMVFIGLSNVAFAQVHSTCKSAEPASVIKVFTQAIDLNNKFMMADHKDTYALRTKVEKFQEEELTPCLKRAVEILSSENQPELASKLFDVVISYSNSADETISYSLGLIFGENPDVLENTLQQFAAKKQKVVLKRLSEGWLNAKTEFGQAVVKERDGRLKSLLASSKNNAFNLQSVRRQ